MRRLFLPFVVLLLVLNVNSAFAQYGLNISAIGPVNRGMGGVATATPIDALGALHWNPATIAALPSSEMAFGVDGVLPVVDIDSSLGADALAPGVPSVDRAGSSESDGGWFAAPAFGVVQQVDDSPYTYGLGIMTVAGFGQNFSASTTNPILFPDEVDAEGVPGFGNIFAEAVFIEIAPVIAMQVTDNISIGLGPTVTIGRAQASPFPFTAPDNAGGGSPTYPEGTHTRYHWGGGDFRLERTWRRILAGILAPLTRALNGLKSSAITVLTKSVPHATSRRSSRCRPLSHSVCRGREWKMW
jgi:long-chain fatty acid transport protein